MWAFAPCQPATSSSGCHPTASGTVGAIFSSCGLTRWTSNELIWSAMIVILNGPLGVGKTEVAWKLIEKFERAVMLDGDYLGAVHPFEIRDEQRVAYLYDAALKYDLADRY